MTDNYEQIIRDTAQKLNLLTANGELKNLDSLSMIDMVVELESVAQVSIPSASIDPASFSSVSALAGMLRDLGE